MDPKYSQHESTGAHPPRPIGIEFNMGIVGALTAFAGLIIGALVYWLMSSTKKPVPKDFVGSSGFSQSTSRRRQNFSGPMEMQSSYRQQVDGDDSFSDADTDEDDNIEDRRAHGASSQSDKPKKKIGVKKAAKLEMKAEKRAAREAMLLEREEKKREQEYMDQLRKEEEDRLKKEEEEREEQERLEKEEQAKREHEAYLEMAKSFEVEEEGFDQEQEGDGEEKLAQFINYIKEQKVVLLEQLAVHFKMRTKDVVDRVQELISNGSLVGIIDDRGKFISITQGELESVAKFIRQRGRVTIDELVVNSNKFINLKPQEVKTT